MERRNITLRWHLHGGGIMQTSLKRKKLSSLSAKDLVRSTGQVPKDPSIVPFFFIPNDFNFKDMCG